MCLTQAGIAQSVEHFTRNEGVVSSSLISSLTDMGLALWDECESWGSRLFVWIYGGRECRCGQGFREGNGKLVRQRDVASIRGESRAPEGEDIGPGKDSVGGYNN